MTRFSRATLLGLFATVLFGCAAPGDSAPSITLATTTSTRDSGLLDELLPEFQRQTGIEVRVVAVGSGQALELGRRGDADVLLTHAPDAERQFMEAGYGERRWPVMYNDFVLVGPESDPAGVAAAERVADGLKRIAENQATFVSRGDDSGTHMKEQALWQQADSKPQGDWYLEAGSGMAATLRLASEEQAYTLTDRGTYLAQQDGLQLTILHEGDPLLRNPYAVMVVSARKHPNVQRDAAWRFAQFLLEEETQQRIGRFGSEKYGQPLFFPDAPESTENG